MYMPMRSLPLFVAKLVQASISIKRIDNFMRKEQLGSRSESFPTSGNDVAVSVSDGTFNWGNGSCQFRLSHINLTVKRGAFVAIAGGVGSGKSSLLSAILGDMDREEGQVCTNVGMQKRKILRIFTSCKIND